MNIGISFILGLWKSICISNMTGKILAMRI